MGVFRPKEFLPARLIDRITELRVTDPERPLRAARSRKRREQITRDGRLNILAADHPARRVLAIPGNQLGMADRHDYLARIVRVLQRDEVDGVMATMDILEDLLVLHELLAEEGGTALLDGKLLIASLNRGGLSGVSWEMDDPMTGATPATVAAWNLDGAKILLRICDDEPDSLRTITATVRAITELNAFGLPMFLEPLPTVKTEKGYKVVKTSEALTRIVGAASALGDSSRHLWLKLPYCENYEAVVQATTLPILLLGGESTGDPTQFMREVEAGMSAGPNVRGVLVGRNVLYPGDADPADVAAAIGRILRNQASAETALDV
ncbi:MAG: deoxyribose-phosphate aldolase [Acidobacteria bacterium]|nr:deoxyribose-phosphate aldolase [Acidobacteriota bacterium]